MTALSVNLNKVALLRNQRDLPYPDIADMARLCLDAGADGITVHPRPDGRHIRPSDVRRLSALLGAEYRDGAEFNIEGYPSGDFLALVEQAQPRQVTLVPDAPDQVTSDHGWNIPANAGILKDVIARLKSGTNARIALFVDDDPAMAGPARDAGADRVELYTGPYYRAFVAGRADRALESFSRTADAMRHAGLGINAGHDLNLDNLPGFLGAVPDVREVSIGHALTADALVTGMAGAVRRYADTIARAHAAAQSRQSRRCPDPAH